MTLTKPTATPSPTPAPIPNPSVSVVRAETVLDEKMKELTGSSLETVDNLNVPAEVNLNTGINRHMDDLRQRYPAGHWPDDPVFEPDAVNEIDGESDEYENEYYYDDDENKSTDNGEDKADEESDVRKINLKENLKIGEQAVQ